MLRSHRYMENVVFIRFEQSILCNFYIGFVELSWTLSPNTKNVLLLKFHVILSVAPIGSPL